MILQLPSWAADAQELVEREGEPPLFQVVWHGPDLARHAEHVYALDACEAVATVLRLHPCATAAWVAQ